MHVTRDVSFHETIPHFGSECTLQGEIRDEAATPNKILEPDEDNWLVVDSNLTGIHEEGSDLNFRDEGNYEEEDNSSEKFEVQESNVLDLQDESLDVKQDSTDPIQVEEVNSDGVYGQLKREPIISNSLNILQDNEAPRFLVRSTRGIPRKQYQAYLNTKSKYPIGSYVSSQRCWIRCLSP
uniref:Uncharacterized protein n=1 Tax=Lactuca sativa TaxID=4236 RepID=A0A9R1X4X7_LACSA|nr:hypothetical protein LSAT_V11C600329600 [Lactuca sativa]